LRILIIIVACVMLYFLLRHLFRQNPQTFTRYFFFALIGIFILLLLVLAITGRLHWLFALLAGLLPWLRRLSPLLRLAPLLRLFGGMTRMDARPSAGQASNVHSQFFSMELNHDSGEISGEVLQGEYTGRFLRQLNNYQLKRLLNECRADKDSYALLCSYLNYRLGGNWQSQFGMDEQANGGEQANDDAASEQAMNYQEALDILGLHDPINKDDIVKAHRSMMQKFHPDRGGSNYLAAKINEAKVYLLHFLQD